MVLPPACYGSGKKFIFTIQRRRVNFGIASVYDKINEEFTDMSKEDNSDELDTQEQQRIEEADTDGLPNSSKRSFRSITIRVNAAPTPSTRAKLAAQTSTSLQTYDPLGSQQRQLVKQGPSCQDPNGPAETSKGKVGQVERNVTFDDVAFDTNRKLFQKSGIALAPDDRGSVIAKDRGHYRPVVNLFSLDGGQAKRQRLEQLNAQQPLLVEGSDDEAIYGIWGPPTAHERHQELEAITDVASGKPLLPEQLAERAFLEEKARRKGLLSEETTTAQQQDRLVERKMSHLLPPRLEGEEATPIEPSTKFHGAADFDYKGLPWIAPPAGVKPILFGDIDHHRCYVPKKCVHRFTGRALLILHFLFLCFVGIFIHFKLLNFYSLYTLFRPLPIIPFLSLSCRYQGCTTNTAISWYRSPIIIGWNRRQVQGLVH